MQQRPVMHTIGDYLACAKEIRNIIYEDQPVPLYYQQLIEQFVPTAERFPQRRVITVFEYPNTNPQNFLENKRGFRLQYMFVFVTNEFAYDFHKKLGDNYALKWECGRYMIESCDNIVFIKTRGQLRKNFLHKLEKGSLPVPLCLFYFDLKQKELLSYLEQGNWSVRIVWGPPAVLPLYGIQDEEYQNFTKEEKIENKMVLKKQEIAEKHIQEQAVNDSKEIANQIVLPSQEQSVPKEKQQIKIVNCTKSIDYFIELGKQKADELVQEESIEENKSNLSTKKQSKRSRKIQQMEQN